MYVGSCIIYPFVPNLGVPNAASYAMFFVKCVYFIRDSVLYIVRDVDSQIQFQ